MPEQPAIRCLAVQSWLAGVAVLGLTACSIQVQEPADGAVITLSPSMATTKVVVTGNASYTGLKVTVDGNDFSNQMVSKSASRDEGDLALALGKHTLVASAEVYCWYCTGRTTQSTVTKTFSVVVLGKTTFAQRDGLSWASLSNANLSYASDTGETTTRWRFTRLGGIGSTVGRIESIEFPSTCLRSPDNTNGSVIVLATCDVNDIRQQWFGTRQQLSGGRGFYRFENRQLSQDGFTWGCLTEASGNSQVIQSACTDTPDRLWAVRNNTGGISESEVNPWGE